MPNDYYSETIHLPDASRSEETPDNPPSQPAEVPPVEVPGRPEAPEHVPEKA